MRTPPDTLCFVELQDTLSWCKYAPSCSLSYVCLSEGMNDFFFYLLEMYNVLFSGILQCHSGLFQCFIQCINWYPFAIKNSCISPFGLEFITITATWPLLSDLLRGCLNGYKWFCVCVEFTWLFSSPWKQGICLPHLQRWAGCPSCQTPTELFTLSIYSS